VAKWEALAPIPVSLENETLSCEDITVTRYDENELNNLLEDDKDYWPHVNFDLDYKSGYWLKFEIDAESSQDAWTRSIEKTILFLETLELYKTTYCILVPAGLLVKGLDRGLNAHFGWENTIVGKPRYSLQEEEYHNLTKFFVVYKKFWSENKVNLRSSEYLKRMNWAKYYLRKAYETINLNERYIFLSIALEALCGEGEAELRYRYANRAALLLGDDEARRKSVNKFILKGYDTRSKIIHGGVKWRIELDEVLCYTETIRQMIVRCISLYSKGCHRFGKTLDECLHDSAKHAELLNKSKSLFGDISEFKSPEKGIARRAWKIRE
jgi:hypothetical protein